MCQGWRMAPNSGRSSRAKKPPLETAPDRPQDDDIGGRDAQQERRRNPGADHPAHRLDPLHLALQRRGRGGDGDAGQHHHRGMPQREPGADGMRLLALLHQLAHHIVDGGDVVGIHGVAQAEDPRQKRRAQQRRTIRKRRPGPQPGRQIGRGQAKEQRAKTGCGHGAGLRFGGNTTRAAMSGCMINDCILLTNTVGSGGGRQHVVPLADERRLRL
jgi:hypothetical protein